MRNLSYKVKTSRSYEKKYLEMVKDVILGKARDFECRVFLFGSRASDGYKCGADFDIGIEGIGDKNFFRLKYEVSEQIEESIVPYKVDIVNFDKVSENFKKEAYKKIEIWK